MADNSPVAQMYIEATAGGSLEKLARQVQSFTSKQPKINLGLDLKEFESGAAKARSIFARIYKGGMSEFKTQISPFSFSELFDAKGSAKPLLNSIINDMRTSVPAFKAMGAQMWQAMEQGMLSAASGQMASHMASKMNAMRNVLRASGPEGQHQVKRERIALSGRAAGLSESSREVQSANAMNLAEFARKVYNKEYKETKDKVRAYKEARNAAHVRAFHTGNADSAGVLAEEATSGILRQHRSESAKIIQKVRAQSDASAIARSKASIQVTVIDPELEYMKRREKEMRAVAKKIESAQTKAEKDHERQAKKSEASRDKLPSLDTNQQRELRRFIDKQFLENKKLNMPIADAANKAVSSGARYSEIYHGTGGQSVAAAEYAGRAVLAAKTKALNAEIEKEKTRHAAKTKSVDKKTEADDKRAIAREANQRSMKGLLGRVYRDVIEPNLSGSDAVFAATQSREAALQEGLASIGRRFTDKKEAEEERSRFKRDVNRAYGPHLNTLLGSDPEASDALAQQAFMSVTGGSVTGLGNRPEAIKDALESAKAKRLAQQAEYDAKAADANKKGDKVAFSQMSAEAKKAARDVSELNYRLSQHADILKQMEKMDAKKPGGLFGGINAAKRRTLENKMQGLVGPSASKSDSAHGMNFAMMNAAYGFQDFFQVLAQPGMGVMRATLAAANNVGPALAGLGFAGATANVGVGVLLAGMAGLNMVMQKEDEKLKEVSESVGRLAEAYAKAERARAGFLSGSMPSGSDPGGSEFSKTIQRIVDAESIGKELGGISRISMLGTDRSLRRDQQDQRDRLNFQEVPGGIGRTVTSMFEEASYLFDNKKYRTPVGRDAVYEGPLSLNQMEEKYSGFTAFQEGQGADRLSSYSREHSIAKSKYEEFWKKDGPGERMEKQSAEMDALSAVGTKMRQKSETRNQDVTSGAQRIARFEEIGGPMAVGSLKKYLEKTLAEMPYDAMAANTAKEKAKNRLSLFEERNGNRITELRSQAGSLGRSIRSAVGDDNPGEIVKLESDLQLVNAELKFLEKERSFFSKSVEDIEKSSLAIEDLVASLNKIPGAARMIKQILFADDKAARQSNFGGNLEKGVYGGKSGKMLNFEDRIQSMRESLSEGLRGKLSDQGKSDLRSAHAKAVAREIESMVGSGTGKTTMMDSGSVWQRIQESLSNGPGLQVEEQQLEELRKIHADLLLGKNPVSPLWSTMSSPAEGHDSGGFAGNYKKPSFRDTINAKLRLGEVVLTPEHQARIASMFGLTPKSLFGSMGMTSSGPSSLADWAGSPIGFDGGGRVGRSMDADNNGGGGVYNSTSRIPKYGNLGAFVMPSSMGRGGSSHPGYPSSGLGNRHPGGIQKTDSRGSFFGGRYWMGNGQDMPSNSEQANGLLGAYGKSAYDEGRSYSPHKQAWRQFRKLHGQLTGFNRGNRKWDEEEPFRDRYAEYGRQSARFGKSGFYRNQGPLYPRGDRMPQTTGGPSRGVTNAEAWPGGMPYFGQRGQGELPGFNFSTLAQTLPEERLRESAAQSSFLTPKGRASMENAAKARESRDYVKRQRRYGFTAEQKARDEQSSRMSQKARESMQRTWEKADAAKKRAEEYASMTPEERRQRGNDAAQAKVEAKRAGPAFDNKQAYLDNRAMGMSKEEAQAHANRQESEFKNKQGPVSSTTRGSSRTNSWMAKADVAPRDSRSGGLSAEKQARLDELSKDEQASRSVSGGDRGARWRSGMEDNKKMEQEASEGAMDAWKQKFDELPGKLMQNVGGKEQAGMGGVSSTALDRQNNLLEKVVQTLESASVKSEKAAKNFVDAIENSGLVIA